MQPHRGFVYAIRSVLVVFLAFALPAAVSCSRPEITKFEYFRITVDGQPTLGISAKDAMVRAVVIFFHGMGTSDFTMTSDQAHSDLTAALVDAGFAVFSSAAGGDAWGNPASQHNYLYIGGIAAEHYGTANVFFVAETMGALAATNFLAQGFSPRVKGFAAINPVFDIESMPAKYKPSINASYPNQSLAAASPINFPLDSFNNAKMMFFVSPDATEVPAGPNADAFTNKFGPHSNITTVPCAGEIGDPSCFQGDAIVKWFSQLEAGTAK